MSSKVPVLLLGSLLGASCLKRKRLGELSELGLTRNEAEELWLWAGSTAVVAGLLYYDRKKRGFSGLEMSDDAHGQRVLVLAEQAHTNLNRLEELLKKRRGKKTCMSAFRSLKAAYTPIIAAKEQAESVDSGRAKYDELVNDMANDFTALQEQLGKRCGRMERGFKYKWGRKCIQWYGRKKKGRRICKKYKRIRRR